MDLTTLIEETFNIIYMERSFIHTPLILNCNVCGKSNNYFNERIIYMNTESIENLGPLSIGDIMNKILNDEVSKFNSKKDFQPD